MIEPKVYLSLYIYYYLMNDWDVWWWSIVVVAVWGLARHWLQPITLKSASSLSQLVGAAMPVLLVVVVDSCPVLSVTTN